MAIKGDRKHVSQSSLNNFIPHNNVSSKHDIQNNNINASTSLIQIISQDTSSHVKKERPASDYVHRRPQTQRNMETTKSSMQ